MCLQTKTYLPVLKANAVASRPAPVIPDHTTIPKMAAAGEQARTPDSLQTRQTMQGVFTTTTDAGGNYSLAGLPGGTYSIYAAKTGLVFTPSSQRVTLSGEQAGVNFAQVSSSTLSGDMDLIPAGTFQMGCDPAHNGGYSWPPMNCPCIRYIWTRTGSTNTR